MFWQFNCSCVAGIDWPHDEPCASQWPGWLGHQCHSASHCRGEMHSCVQCPNAEPRAPVAAPFWPLSAFKRRPHPVLGLPVRAARLKTEPCQLRWTLCANMQRILLWERRNNTVAPFGETVQQVYARISALRDRLDGPGVKPHHDTLNSFHKFSRHSFTGWSAGKISGTPSADFIPGELGIVTSGQRQISA